MLLATSPNLPIPGAANFPMNDYMEGPKDRNEEELMRSYLQQLRVETLYRLCDRVFKTDTADAVSYKFSSYYFRYK